MKLTAFIVRNQILILFCLFFLSFSIKVGLTYREFSLNGMKEWADAVLYLEHGKSFAAGDFYPKYGIYDYIVVGPVIPLIVAVSQVTTGDPVWPVLVLNCLFGALLVFVLYYIGKRLVSPTAGLILSVWSVFNFDFIRLNAQIVKEPLVTLLLPAIVLCMLQIIDNKKPVLMVTISSIAFSLLIHTDERFIVYLPILMVFYLLFSIPSRRMVNTGLWVMVLLITMIPWTVRNYRQFGELVILTPRTTAFTSKLWGSSLTQMHISSVEEEDQFYERFKDDAREAQQKYGVIPRRYGRYEKYWRAFINYWQPCYCRLTYIMYGNRPMKWSLLHNLNSLLFYGIFLPFYLGAIVLCIIKRNWLMLFLASLPLIHGFLHTVMVWPLERYRLPFNFLIVILALWFVEHLVTKGNKTADPDLPTNEHE